MKLRLLLSSVTLIVLLCVFHIDSWLRNEAYERQKLDSQRQAEELAAVERAKDQPLIAEEDLRLGDLELEASNQLDVRQQKPQIAATPQLYKRICGWLPSSHSNAKAQYDMHECHAGSPICTSGGTISIESHNRLISTISLNLLRPDENGKLRSTFQVKWWDTTLSLSARKSNCCKNWPAPPSRLIRPRSVGYCDRPIARTLPRPPKTRHRRKLLMVAY